MATPAQRLRYVILDRAARKNGVQSPRRWYPGMACAICGEAIRRWQEFNHDHQVPLSKGGAKGRKNKTFTHVVCNTVKGCKHPFSLKTPAEREAIREQVKPQTWAKLVVAWNGG